MREGRGQNWNHEMLILPPIVVFLDPESLIIKIIKLIDKDQCKRSATIFETLKLHKPQSVSI